MNPHTRSKIITLSLLLFIALTCAVLYTMMQRSRADQHRRLKNAGVHVPSGTDHR